MLEAVETQINEFINNKKKMEKYHKEGFKIEICDKYIFSIKYKNKKYTIKPIKDNNEYYWLLQPYNNSIYKTFIKNGLDIVFFAIKENEELYS